jgi:hypothetical protein
MYNHALPRLKKSKRKDRNKMVSAGIAVVMGAFLHSLLSDGKHGQWFAWQGAIVAVLSCPPVRQKIGPQSGKKSVVYNLALGVLLFALALTNSCIGVIVRTAKTGQSR